MDRPIRDYVLAFGIAALAGLGGAAVVLADVDDAPGGMLIGFLMVVSAAALHLRTSRAGE
ncbi:MAG: hypothetical protein AAF389_15840 [Gemmatimonadota bacterium]